MPPANLSTPRFSGSNTPLVAFETKRTLKMPFTFMREVSIWPPPPTKNREDRAKEGWTRHQEISPFFWRRGAKREPGRAKHQERGWFVQLPIIGGLNQPLFLVSPCRAHIRSAHARLRPLRRLRGIFLMGAATPPCPRRGLRLSLQLFSMPPVSSKRCGTWQAWNRHHLLEGAATPPLQAGENVLVQHTSHG